MNFTAMAIVALLVLFPFPPTSAASDADINLAGIWRAKRDLGPALRGPVTINFKNEVWQADVGGSSAIGQVNENHILFDFGTERGQLRVETKDTVLEATAFWIQPPGAWLGRPFVSPISMKPTSAAAWEGTLRPYNDTVTFYLIVSKEKDGTFSAVLRNPEFNLGVFSRVRNLVPGPENTITLEGDYRWSTGQIQALMSGTYDPAQKAMVLQNDFLQPAGAYLFTRISANSDFYPKQTTNSRYIYRQPPETDDGWSVAAAADVGMDEDKLADFIQNLIDRPIDTIDAPDIHAVLVARRGKLVLEEYFHGYQRNQTHDTRSASKTAAASLAGAAEQAGLKLHPSTRVYDHMLDQGSLPANLDPRARTITLEHLMTMSSGFACNDSDSSSPGNEDTMQSQTAEPDWFKYTLSLPMAHTPGEVAAYCSAGSNLIGGMVAKTANRWLPSMFDTLLAKPLQLQNYHMNLMPSGEAYFGGGIRWLPRDFLKLGQLHLNGGTWNGRRILSKEWTERATTHLYDLREQGYGYLWWVRTYPYKGKQVNAYYAGGNGGQYVLVVPELELAIAFFGGNYNHPTLFKARDDYVPNGVLPAVISK